MVLLPRSFIVEGTGNNQLLIQFTNSVSLTGTARGYVSSGPVLPQCPGVVLLLKDASPAVDDNAVGVHLILHVGGVGGAVQREQERAV